MLKSNKILALFISGLLLSVVYYGLKNTEFFNLIYKLGLLVIVSIVSLLFCKFIVIKKIWIPIVMTFGVIIGVAIVLLFDTLFTSISHDMLAWEVAFNAGIVFVFSWIGTYIHNYLKSRYGQSK